MKYLVLLLVVLGVWWLVRTKVRRVDPPGPAHKPLQSMVACAHCGVHLPAGEALPGRGGVFCGEAHRAAYEQAHPAP